MIAATLGRFDMHEVAGVERLHWLWVIGPQGAASTWFGDTLEILGHSVCDGVTLHSVTPLEHFEHSHGWCTVMNGTDVWCQRQTMLETPGAAKLYDAGELEAVYWWLADWYMTMRMWQVASR